MKLFLYTLNMRGRIPLKTPLELYQTSRSHAPHDSRFKQKFFEMQLNTKKCHMYCQSRAAKVIPKNV